MSWNNEARRYILSENIKKPIIIKILPDILFEYFCDVTKNLPLRLIFVESIGINMNGIANPNE